MVNTQLVTYEEKMKVKGIDKLLDEDLDIVDLKHDHGHEDDYKGGVQKIKTTIGKLRKQEDSQYKHHDTKRFKKK